MTMHPVEFERAPWGCQGCLSEISNKPKGRLLDLESSLVWAGHVAQGGSLVMTNLHNSQDAMPLQDNTIFV